jgi:nucleotide-binding universal stress UspA family protein
VNPSPLLVFGDDGSPSADRAWGWITSQRWPDWSIEVLTVESPPLPRPHDPDEAAPEPEPHEAEPGRTPGTDLGATVSHLVAEGDPRSVLASRTDADLMVIGPRGKGLIDRLIVGSVASYLLGAPPAPLAMVRHSGPVRSILVCADGSSDAERAVEVLAGLPLAQSAEVTVLAVDDDRTPVDQAVSAATTTLRAAGIEAATQREAGMVPGIVLRVIDEREADLVVMGTAGRTGLKRLWLGSTASAVAQVAPSSVLVARADTSA